MIIMKRLMPPSQRTGRLCEWRNIFMGKEVQAGNLMVTGTANALTKVEPGSLTTGQQGQPGHQPYPPSRIQEGCGGVNEQTMPDWRPSHCSGRQK